MSVYYAVMEEVEVTEVDGPSSGKESTSLVWTPAMTLKFLDLYSNLIQNKTYETESAKNLTKKGWGLLCEVLVVLYSHLTSQKMKMQYPGVTISKAQNKWRTLSTSYRDLRGLHNQ